jgi:hypothetical protein
LSISLGMTAKAPVPGLPRWLHEGGHGNLQRRWAAEEVHQAQARAAEVVERHEYGGSGAAGMAEAAGHGAEDAVEVRAASVRRTGEVVSLSRRTALGGEALTAKGWQERQSPTIESEARPERVTAPGELRVEGSRRPQAAKSVEASAARARAVGLPPRVVGEMMRRAASVAAVGQSAAEKTREAPVVAEAEGRLELLTGTSQAELRIEMARG